MWAISLLFSRWSTSHPVSSVLPFQPPKHEIEPSIPSLPPCPSAVICLWSLCLPLTAFTQSAHRPTWGASWGCGQPVPPKPPAVKFESSLHIFFVSTSADERQIFSIFLSFHQDQHSQLHLHFLSPLPSLVHLNSSTLRTRDCVQTGAKYKQHGS